MKTDDEKLNWTSQTFLGHGCTEQSERQPPTRFISDALFAQTFGIDATECHTNICSIWKKLPGREICEWSNCWSVCEVCFISKWGSGWSLKAKTDVSCHFYLKSSDGNFFKNIKDPSIHQKLNLCILHQHAARMWWSVCMLWLILYVKWTSMKIHNFSLFTLFFNMTCLVLYVCVRENVMIE